MTNYQILCEPVETGFRYEIHQLSAFRAYRPRRFILPFEVAEQIYPLYDTYERVEPLDDELIYKISKNKSDVVVEADEIADAILKHVPIKECTKGIITDYCMRNNKRQSKEFIEIVHNSIKARQYKSLNKNKLKRPQPHATWCSIARDGGNINELVLEVAEMDTTSVTIPKALHTELTDLKVHKRQALYEVIWKLVKEHKSKTLLSKKR